MPVSPPSQPAASSATPALAPQGKHAGKPSMPMGRVFTLAGSRHRAHLHLLSPSVSKAHAAIINDGGSIYIRDTASREHVYVNDKLVKETEIHHGDLIRIGTFSFTLIDGSGKSGRVQAQRPTDAALEVSEGKLPLLFEGRTLVIGRRPTCDVVLKEMAVSNVHAIIFQYGGQHIIRDLGSRTGTYVNGEQVHQQALKFGDQLRIGDHEMQFVAAQAEQDIDELEHLIGTARLGEESLELASQDAARLGMGATPAAPAPPPAHARRSAASTPPDDSVPAHRRAPQAPAIAARPAAPLLSPIKTPLPPMPPMPQPPAIAKRPAASMPEPIALAELDRTQPASAGPGDTQSVTVKPAPPAIDSRKAPDQTIDQNIGDEVGVEQEERHLLVGGTAETSAAGLDAFEPTEPIPLDAEPQPPAPLAEPQSLAPLGEPQSLAPAEVAPEFDDLGLEVMPEEEPLAELEQPSHLTAHTAASADIIPVEDLPELPAAASEPQAADTEPAPLSPAAEESERAGLEQPSHLTAHAGASADIIPVEDLPTWPAAASEPQAADTEPAPAGEFPELDDEFVPVAEDPLDAVCYDPESGATVLPVLAEPESDPIAERAALFIESAEQAGIASFPQESSESPAFTALESHPAAEQAEWVAETASVPDFLTAPAIDLEAAAKPVVEDQSRAMEEHAASLTESAAIAPAVDQPAAEPREFPVAVGDESHADGHDDLLREEPSLPDLMSAATPALEAAAGPVVEDEARAMEKHTALLAESAAIAPDVNQAPVEPWELPAAAGDESHADGHDDLLHEEAALPDLMSAITPALEAAAGPVVEDESRAMEEHAALLAESAAIAPDVNQPPVESREFPAAAGDESPAEGHDDLLHEEASLPDLMSAVTPALETAAGRVVEDEARAMEEHAASLAESAAIAPDVNQPPVESREFPAAAGDESPAEGHDDLLHAEPSLPDLMSAVTPALETAAGPVVEDEAHAMEEHAALLAESAAIAPDVDQPPVESRELRVAAGDESPAERHDDLLHEESSLPDLMSAVTPALEAAAGTVVEDESRAMEEHAALLAESAAIAPDVNQPPVESQEFPVAAGDESPAERHDDLLHEDASLPGLMSAPAQAVEVAAEVGNGESRAMDERTALLAESSDVEPQELPAAAGDESQAEGHDDLLHEEAALPDLMSAPALAPEVAAEGADRESRAMEELAALLSEPAEGSDTGSIRPAPGEVATAASHDLHAAHEQIGLHHDAVAPWPDVMTAPPSAPEFAAHTAAEESRAFDEFAALLNEPALPHAGHFPKASEELPVSSDESPVPDAGPLPDAVTAPASASEFAAEAIGLDETHGEELAASLSHDGAPVPDAVTAPSSAMEVAEPVAEDESRAMEERLALLSESAAGLAAGQLPPALSHAAAPLPDALSASESALQSVGEPVVDDESREMEERLALLSEPAAAPAVEQLPAASSHDADIVTASTSASQTAAQPVIDDESRTMEERLALLGEPAAASAVEQLPAASSHDTDAVPNVVIASTSALQTATEPAIDDESRAMEERLTLLNEPAAASTVEQLPAASSHDTDAVPDVVTASISALETAADPVVGDESRAMQERLPLLSEPAAGLAVEQELAALSPDLARVPDVATASELSLDDSARVVQHDESPAIQERPGSFIEAAAAPEIEQPAALSHDAASAPDVMAAPASATGPAVDHVVGDESPAPNAPTELFAEQPPLPDVMTAPASALDGAGVAGNLESNALDEQAALLSKPIGVSPEALPPESLEYPEPQDSATPLPLDSEAAEIGELHPAADAPADEPGTGGFAWDLPLSGDVPPPFPAGLHPTVADGALGLPRLPDVRPAAAEEGAQAGKGPEASPPAQISAADPSLLEVIGPTEPTPESAQPLSAPMDELLPDSPAGPVAAVEPLTDSQLDRAMQDFAGSALGSLVEQNAESVAGVDAAPPENSLLHAEPVLPDEFAHSISGPDHDLGGSSAGGQDDSLPSFEEILAHEGLEAPTGDALVDQANAFLEYERAAAGRNPGLDSAPPASSPPVFPRFAEYEISSQDLNAAEHQTLAGLISDEAAAEFTALPVDLPPNPPTWAASDEDIFAPAEPELASAASTHPHSAPADADVDGAIAAALQQDPAGQDAHLDHGPAAQLWPAEDSGQPAFQAETTDLIAHAGADAGHDYGLEFEEPTLEEVFAPVALTTAPMPGELAEAPPSEPVDLFAPEDPAAEDAGSAHAPMFEVAATAADGLILGDEAAEPPASHAPAAEESGPDVAPAAEDDLTVEPEWLADADETFATNSGPEIPAAVEPALAEPQALDPISPETQTTETGSFAQNLAELETIEPAAAELPTNETGQFEPDFLEPPAEHPAGETTAAESQAIEPPAFDGEIEPAPVELEAAGTDAAEADAIETSSAEPEPVQPPAPAPLADRPAGAESAAETVARPGGKAVLTFDEIMAAAVDPGRARSAAAMPEPSPSASAAADSAQDESRSDAEPPQAAPPAGSPASRMNPMLGMSRDLGSFLGGVPLALPTAPVRPAPVRRPRPLFGETPVSVLLNQNSGPAPMVTAASTAPLPPIFPAAQQGAGATPALPGATGQPPTSTAPLQSPAATTPPQPPVAPPAPQALTAPADIIAPTAPSPDEAAGVTPPPADQAVTANAGVIAPHDAPSQEFEIEETPPAEEWAAEIEPTADHAPAAEANEQEPPKLFDSAPEALDGLTHTLEPIADITEAVGEAPAPAAAPDRPSVAGSPAPPAARSRMGPSADGGAAPSADAAKPRRPLPPPPARSVSRRSQTNSLIAPDMGMDQDAPAESVDVFSHLPAEQDESVEVPEIPPTGYVPPAAPPLRRSRPRPPMQRRPAEPVPADKAPGKKLVERKATMRKPAVAEPMEQQESDTLFPPEQASPLEGDAPDPATDSEQNKKRKKRWRFPFFKMSLLVLAAGALGACAWFGLSPKTEVAASLRFERLDKLSPAERQAFVRSQQTNLGAEQFRQRVRQIYESDYHGYPGDGFLYRQDDAKRSFAAIVEGLHADGDRLVFGQRDTIDLAGDRLRLRAVAAALYAVNRQANGGVATSRAEVEAAAARLAGMQAKLHEAQQRQADFEIARRKEKDLADGAAMLEKKWRDAKSAADALQVEFNAVADSRRQVEENPQVKEMTIRLKPLSDALIAARAAQGGDIAAAAQALEASLAQFQQQIDTFKPAPDDVSGLAGYVAVAGQALAAIRQTTSDLAQRRKLAVQTAADLKRDLAEKVTANLKTIYVADKALAKLELDRSVEEHRLGAAVSADLTADAAQIRSRVQELKNLIEARQQVIAPLAVDTPEITALRKLIAGQAIQARGEQDRAAQRVDEQFKLLAAAAPKSDALPAGQQKILAALDQKLSAVKAAQEQTVLIGAGTSAADVAKLESQVAELQAQVDARRREAATFISASNPTVADSAAFAQKQAALETARSAEQTALDGYTSSQARLATAQAALDPLQSAQADFVSGNKEVGKLQIDLDELKSRQHSWAGLGLLSQDPASEDPVQILPGRDFRPAVLTAIIVLLLAGTGWLINSWRRETAGQLSDDERGINIGSGPSGSLSPVLRGQG